MPVYECTFCKVGSEEVSVGSRKRGIRSPESFVLTVPEGGDLQTRAIEFLLNEKRERRCHRLLNRFRGDWNNMEEVAAALPAIWRPFATSLADLKLHLACVRDIIERYRIESIHEVAACSGCRYALGGQADHMECNTGCLHDPMLCGMCGV